MNKERPGYSVLWTLLALLALGFFLRLWAINHDFPAALNADEPYFIKTAVSFGGGTLNPPIFKYPTLWLYSLFAGFGAFFLFWSGFGMLHSPTQFGYLFVWHPEYFYFIGRLLAALVSLGAVLAVFYTGKRYWNSATGLAAAALLALSPPIVEAAHYAKWDSLVLFLSCLCWHFAVGIAREGKKRQYLACGLSLGLLFSTHYMSAFFAVILPVAHIIRAKRDKTALRAAVFAKDFWFAVLLIPAGFLAGSPYAALDFQKFYASIADIFHYSSIRKLEAFDRGQIVSAAIGNIVHFCGATPFAFMLAVCGAALFAWRGQAYMPLLLLSAVPVYLYVLAGQPDGGFVRYVFNSFPALALLAGYAVSEIETRFSKKAALCCALAAVLPGLWQSAVYDKDLLIPDTRNIASAWIEKNIPAESRILIDQLHESPSLRVSKEQARKLYEQTEKLGHVKSKYYKLMLDSHPGGGYQVVMLRRSSLDLAVFPAHLDWSSQGYEWFDIIRGVKGLKDDRVEYVVESSFGIDQRRFPNARKFFDEVRKNSVIVNKFLPETGKTAGPAILIYKLAGS